MAATTPTFFGGAIALGIFLAAVPHFARTQVLVFDAATVKPNNSGTGSSSTESTNGLLRITNQTLLRMIQYAYGVRDFQISGGPAWVRSDRYDVTAKPEGSAHDQQMKQMLQSLLAERFQLQFHRQTQEGPIYALLIGKNGPKLQPAPESDNSGISLNSTAVRTTMKGTHVTMERLAANLGDRIGRPVVDKTGLSGKFDFELSWVADLTLATGTLDPGADVSGPSIFTALQEQLGLRLNSQQGPIEMLLIDHAEKPTEN
jgi:uncharacterized protein (TIGR03435 family)